MLGLYDLVDLITYFPKFNESEYVWPNYLVGITNPKLAAILVKRFGFDRFILSESLMQQAQKMQPYREQLAIKVLQILSPNQIQVPTESIVGVIADYNELLENTDKLLDFREKTMKTLEKRFGFGVKEARQRAISVLKVLLAV